jgi:DNA-binding MarR family transcriptional regulator
LSASDAASGESIEKDRIVLGLLESLERDGGRSQRDIAAELGIALGLVNAYLKRCVKKGLVKVNQAPARRYAYYLTPHGFAEKSRLTVDYLSYSFSFFRQAKADCTNIFEQVSACGCHRVVLAGISDLAEIATLCALEQKIEIVAVVDADAAMSHFVGVAVVRSFSDVSVDFDAVVVTDVRRAASVKAAAIDHARPERVFVPALLGVRTSNEASK